MKKSICNNKKTKGFSNFFFSTFLYFHYGTTHGDIHGNIRPTQNQEHQKNKQKNIFLPGIMAG